MAPLAEPDFDPCAPVAVAPPLPTSLQARTDASRLGLAATFRALQALSGQVAAGLEAGSIGDETVGSIQAFDRLSTQAGAQLECLGALVSSAGSA